MLSNIEPTLFIDPQTAKPLTYCPACGGALYGSGACVRCERRAP